MASRGVQSDAAPSCLPHISCGADVAEDLQHTCQVSCMQLSIRLACAAYLQPLMNCLFMRSAFAACLQSQASELGMCCYPAADIWNVVDINLRELLILWVRGAVGQNADAYMLPSGA